MDKKINLRELKKAKTKLLLLQTTIDLASQGKMKELHVEEICAQAEVSKVTFFNYFAQKEDLFLYFMAIWGFHRAVEQDVAPLKGIAGIRRIFHCAATEGDQHPGMFLSLIRFLAGVPGVPFVPPVTDAEKQVLYPDLDIKSETYPHLYELFQHFLHESVENGEVRAHLSVKELIYIVITMFYGGFLSAHTTGATNIKNYYDMHLNLLLADAEDVLH